MDRPRIHSYLFELYHPDESPPHGVPRIETLFEYGIKVEMRGEDEWDVWASPHHVGGVLPQALMLAASKEEAFELARLARDEWRRGCDIQEHMKMLSLSTMCEMYIRKLPTIQMRAEQKELDKAYDLHQTDPPERVPVGRLGSSFLYPTQSRGFGYLDSGVS